MRILVFIIALLIASQSFAGTKRWIPPTIASSCSITDNFARADGTLGANWTTNATDIPAAGTTLKISSQTVVTAANDQHAFAIYTNSPCVISSNQFAECSLVNVVASPGNGWNGGCVLRCAPGTDKFFLGFVFNSQEFAFDVRTAGAFPDYPSAVPKYGAITWSSGDTNRMEVYDGDPARLYMLRNGVLIASTVMVGYGITSGNPGIGLYNPSGKSLADDNWRGGTATAYQSSALTGDNFTRADALTLGGDWVNYSAFGSTVQWFGLLISGNKAKAIANASANQVALCIANLTTHHYASITLPAINSGGIIGVIAGSDFNVWYELVIAAPLPSTSGTVYYHSGGQTYVSVSGVTATWAQGDTVRVEVTANAGNDTLVVKQNGTTRATISDTGHKTGGTHGGMDIYGSDGTTGIAQYNNDHL